ncbi:two-component system, OmpR family, sensor histidine kinase SenX3 [Micromonospora pattaloongensis]|uniref:Sensor-like histidine kinase SenX3 n=1 Tax=Micromonospora pattaloongensis TaxID=405436 RepID=A0A1H3GU36_9ACTN|nr:two-component system, OmpR family, sensor histidine kinase SenX3 [Micromonospora pattaloongensis]
MTGVAGGAFGGVLATVAATRLLLRGADPAADASDRPAVRHRGDGRGAITREQQGPLAGLGRRSLDSLRVGVVVLDKDDEPVLVNPAARAMGLLRSAGRPGTLVAHPIVRTLAGQVRRTGVRREVELDLPRGREGGPQDPLGVHLRAVGLGADYVAVEAADVTEAHRVARVRRDFVANVSHELKTPIGALQLLAEALLDATRPETEVTELSEDVAAARRFAERIHHESNRLGRLVTELLELSRLQGAEPLPAPEPVSVDWVVAEVIDRTRTAATAGEIEIAVEGPRGLTVYGNDNQIATAVANLVANAITYSAVGTRVTLATGRDERYVTIAVTDQGIGIAPDDVERIFERFYRADQARSRTTGGTGLGLAIVKHIATNHGGRVDVASTLGGGSTFTLRLPAVPVDAALPPSTSDEIEAGPAELRQP